MCRITLWPGSFSTDDMDDTTQDAAKRAVVTVGEGRGFIVEATLYDLPRRLILTAAHCLPGLPPTHPASYQKERTFAKLLGRLGDKEPKVWAECLFADPVADIAVLTTPDGQEFYDEAEAYDELTEGAAALRIVDAPQEGPGWLLTLDGRWVVCTVHHSGGPLWIFDAAEPIIGGMSGSPILDADGAAIGVVSCAGGISGEPQTESGPNPRLMGNLPGFLLRGIAR